MFSVIFILCGLTLVVSVNVHYVQSAMDSRSFIPIFRVYYVENVESGLTLSLTLSVTLTIFRSITLTPIYK